MILKTEPEQRRDPEAAGVEEEAVFGQIYQQISEALLIISSILSEVAKLEICLT